jgi:predicted ATPase/class 3 adenylate cyclase/DNA-binding CsgD family transcriptional regulator
MPDLPTGTVTFLFTDIEGNVSLWEQQPDAMRAALARHDAIVEAVVERHGGTVVRPRGEGDSRFAVFPRATEAVTATAEFQQALGAEVWPTSRRLWVRAALHTGEADVRGGDYYGPAVNRCARLRAVARGGQTLVSEVTAGLVRDTLPAGLSLRSLGEHPLRDLRRPERIFELLHPGLPAEPPPSMALASLSTNLPVQRGRLIGRRQEVSAVRELLRRGEVGLLTLTGPGGIGKSRLGLEVAASLLHEFADGAFFVPLADIRDPQHVPAVIGRELGIKEITGQTPLDGLREHLRPKHLLLLLDNFEHLLDAAWVVGDLLRACERLKVLVTSRTVLRLSGEQEFPVPPLAVPSFTRAPDKLSEYGAVALFLERARAADPHLLPTSDNVRAIAAICRRLDGLPLAIELAAARVKLLPPPAMLGRLRNRLGARLGNRLPLLTGGPRDWPERHQTLRKTIDWSFELLSAEERLLLARLSVFVGGCSPEAADAVCNAGRDLSSDVPDVLDLLAALVDKSLIQRDDGVEGEARFVLLETIREYAHERLQTPEDVAVLRWLHAEHYLALAEAAAPELTGPDQAAWLERLETERGNLRAALHWSLEQGAAATAARLGAALWHAERVRALHEVSMALFDELGRSDEAVALGEDPSETAERLTERLGDLARASVLYEEQLAQHGEVGETAGIATLLLNQAELAAAQRDFRRAMLLYKESLILCQDVGERLGIALCLEGLGSVVAAQGEPEHAVRLWAAADAVREAMGAPMRPPHRALREPELARVRAELDPGTYAAAWEEGRGLRPLRATSYALTVVEQVSERVARASQAPPRPSERPAGTGLSLLTPREREVAALVARGLTNREIAAALTITQRTANNHVEHILTKLGFHSRVRLAAWAVQQGLLGGE